MRQILSIVNYKIILYSFLLQQAKGIVSLTKKITTCIDTTSQIFHDDTVWLPISVYHSLPCSHCGKQPNTSILSMNSPSFKSHPVSNWRILSVASCWWFSIDFCYFYRFYYVREAFVLSLEYSLSSSLSPAGEEKKDVPSNSLFLSLHYYESEEVYMNYRMNEVHFLFVFDCSLTFVHCTVHAQTITNNTLFLFWRNRIYSMRLTSC